MPFKQIAIGLIFVTGLFLPVSGQTDELTIVALGDSLTAGYQLPPDASFPARLEKALRNKGHQVTVINAGVSGDTSAGAFSRLGWAVPEKAKLVIIELGANDALRGINPDKTQAALEKIIVKIRDNGAEILLTGMIAPPNLGSAYGDRFNAIFPALARKYQTGFYPFFLAGVAARPELNQSDGIHPTAQGVDVIVAGILPAVEVALEKIATAD